MKPSDARTALGIIAGMYRDTHHGPSVDHLIAEVVTEVLASKIVGRRQETGTWGDSQCLLGEQLERLRLNPEEAERAYQRITEIRAIENREAANRKIATRLGEALQTLAKESKRKSPVKYRGQSLEV